MKDHLFNELFPKFRLLSFNAFMHKMKLQFWSDFTYAVYRC